MRSLHVFFMCIFLTPLIVTFLLISKHRAMACEREIAMLNRIQCQREFKKAQLAAEAKSRQEQIQEFEVKIERHINSKPTDDKN